MTPEAAVRFATGTPSFVDAMLIRIDFA